MVRYLSPQRCPKVRKNNVADEDTRMYCTYVALMQISRRHQLWPSLDEGTGTHSASADIWGTSIPQEGIKIDVTRAGANGAMLVTLQLLVHNMHWLSKMVVIGMIRVVQRRGNLFSQVVKCFPSDCSKSFYIYVFSFKVCGHRKVNQMLAMWRDRLHREQVDNLVMLNMHKRQAGADASDWLCPNLPCLDQTYCNAAVICFRWVLFIQCFVFTSWFHY